MQHLGLSDRIIKLDRNIRFVGILNDRGEVIEGGFQQGVEPLLNDVDEQQLYLHSLSNLTTLELYGQKLGMVRFSMTEHEKVTLMTFPLGDRVLCISATPKADMIKIRSSVMKVLKGFRSKGNIKPGRKKRNEKSKNSDVNNTK
jgi:hypothetical protein